MTRVTVVLVACAVLVALLLVGVAGAQAPTPYYTSISIVNGSDTEDANVVVAFYNQDGSGPPDPDYSMGFTLGPGESKTIINNLSTDLSADILAPPPAIRGATSWAGNAVVYSDQPVVSISNEAASVGSPYGSASYNGLSEDDLSPEYYAPLIAKIGQPDTTINIQNPSSTAVSVTVEYVKDVYGVNYTAPPVAVPGNGSAIWTVPTGALDGTGRFLGAAKITGDGDIGVVVDGIYSTNSPSSDRYNARQSYTGFAGGAAKVVAPLIQKNDSGVWYTGLSLMNLGPGSADVKITYEGFQGTGTDTDCVPLTAVGGLSETVSLNENESRVILTEFGGALDSVALAGLDCFRGAATSEVVSGTGKLAAIVSVAAQNRGDVAIYRGFDYDAASDTLRVPLIQKYLGVAGPNGWCTGVQVANLGGSSADITGTFHVTCDSVTETVVDTATGVAPGSSVTFLQVNGFPLGSLGTRQNCIGSASFSSDAGQPIVAQVQQYFFGAGNPFTGDVLLAYEGLND
jgi:hypothetical protein